ncbi:MAG: hypothetical protein PVG39_13790 [Desulfobacteraceae bacterium]|jgi:hypothetical protein
MKKFIIFLILLISALQINTAMASEDISGTWQGTLAPAPGSELIIQFVITKNDDGSYSVVLNSPDQGAIKDIKASSVTYDSGTLNMDVTDLSGAYEGVFKDGKFEGNWKQEGELIPLNLKPYEKPVLTKEDKARLLGQWHGELKIPTGTHMLVFRFEMKENDDFKGFLDLPNTGGRDIPVNEVELEGDSVKIIVSAANLEFKGKLADAGITGELKVGAQPFPVTLKKGEYKAPTHDLKLPEEIIEQLAGEWHGQLKMPMNMLHVKARFEKTEKGEFVGFYGLPDQNVKGIPITEADIVDGKIVLKIKVANAEYKGKIDGDKLTGEWSQAGMSTIPLSFKKGEYVPPVFNLDLPEETKSSLKGEWHGQLQTPTSLVHVSLRFEATEKGDFLGFYDIPDQKVKDVKVFEANLSDGKLTLKIPNAIYTAKLEGDELKGEVVEQNNRRTALTMKKGKYVPPVYNLDLPKETRDLLSGEWYGKPDKVTLVFRFEKSEKGDFLGFVDNPDTGVPSMPITELEFTDNNLVVKVPHAGAEFKGKFTDNEFTGEWTQNSKPAPLTLKKGKYVPEVYGLNLPKETMKILTGKWLGKIHNNTQTMIFIFEKNKKGDFVGYWQLPEQKLNRIVFTEAKFSNGILTLKEKLGIAEVTGKLSENEYIIEWKQKEGITPINLKKQ